MVALMGKNLLLNRFNCPKMLKKLNKMDNISKKTKAKINLNIL